MCSIVLFVGAVVTCLFDLVEANILTLPTRTALARAASGKVMPIHSNGYDDSSSRRDHAACLFTLDNDVQFLAKQASKSVRQAWKVKADTDLLTVDMLLVGRSFCDIIYIPELQMINDFKSSQAVSSMKVQKKKLSPQNMDLFYEFVYCLKQQRSHFNSARCMAFDQSWGIDSGTKTNTNVQFGREARPPFRSVDVLIKREVDVASRQCKELLSQFKVLTHPHPHPTSESNNSNSNSKRGSKRGSEGSASIGSMLDASVVDGIIGTRLLQTFVLDLLGRHSTAASVYRTQIREG